MGSSCPVETESVFKLSIPLHQQFVHIAAMQIFHKPAQVETYAQSITHVLVIIDKHYR